MPISAERAARVMAFSVLGPLEVTGGGGSVPLTRRREQRILAALLLAAGRVVTVDLIVDCLWPTQPPRTVSSQVRNCVASLRRTLVGAGLAAEAMTRGPAGYQLRIAPAQLDRDRFEELVARGRSEMAMGRPAEAVALLRQADALWRGPALAGLCDGVLAAEVLRLEELRLQAIEDRMEAELTIGRHERVLPELTALAWDHPGRDRLQGGLMLALYRAGRVGDALTSYDRLRRTLTAELGLEPSRRLRDLRQAILVEDEWLLSGSASTPY
jgi:DNA-binding SARP family transcriptional activator